MPEDKLTNKQEAFCREYIKDWNGTQAALRAGYSTASAHLQAPQLLLKTNVAQKIAQLKEQLITKHDKIVQKSLNVIDTTLDEDISKGNIKLYEKAKVAVDCLKGFGVFKGDKADKGDTNITVQVLNFADMVEQGQEEDR